ncbi:MULTISPECIES: VRR-NUC domain-containing protein [unclassified Staphylococcus]|uniref:VRR-NUC domain-containing protein n=1 Tax=unclassified Staphylococcus TaxID=91994 RepID=UPI0021CF1F14|nr:MULTISPECIES: VRR-NUC domain-containing protein [unclassified Staphylococcus]UXR75621.1 VRR-NUC domain-containing protein [Staphylococcus sp. IVB6233]UXR79821.1 VRR-NUC domain-containing protein [Staphylococcus sp. IVB6218]
MRENELQKQIIENLNNSGCKVWRANAGKVRMGKRVIRLLPKGFPDVFGVRLKDGKFIAIEIKKTVGKLSDEQIAFRDWAQSHKIIYGIARSVDDALKIIEEG